MADPASGQSVARARSNGTTGPLDPPGATSALEADFDRQNRALAAELTRAGAQHVTTHFYGPGTHAWACRERELHASLPMHAGCPPCEPLTGGLAVRGPWAGAS